MFKQKELEVVDLIYMIKNSETSYKSKIHKIQNIITSYINENPLNVKVDFLDRFITVKYGIILQRRQSTSDFQGKPEYRNLILDPITDSSAGLDTYDCVKLRNDDYPIFTFIEKVFTYTIDSFDDLKNGHILDEILNNNRYTKQYGVPLLDQDNFKYSIEKINVVEYLTPDDLLKLDMISSLISLATKTCNDIISAEDFIEKEKQKELEKENSENSENSETAQAEPEELDEVAYKGIYDANRIAHITADIKHYIRKISGYGFEGDLLKHLHISMFDDLERLLCIKQFLRLTHMVISKIGYNNEFLASIKDMDLGCLSEDGIFTKNDRLIKIIERVLKSNIISNRDLEFIVALYSDKSHVVGLAVKPIDEAKKLNEVIKINDLEKTAKEYSQFA